MFDWRSVLSVIVLLCGYGVYQILHHILRSYLSPLRDIPGPPSDSFIHGNRKAFLEAPVNEALEHWVAQYGETICFKMHLNEDRLVTLDLKAVSHFVNRTDIYQKPKPILRFFSSILGDGILGTEGELHRKQRRVMNPAFSQAHVNQLSGIFLAKANELRDKLDEILTAPLSQAPGASPSPHRVDMFSWLGKATLDVIGLAGFLYNFDSLGSEKGRPNDLHKSFSSLSRRAESVSLWTVLTTFIPLLRIIPVKQEREFARAKGVMRQIGSRLVQEKKEYIRASTAAGEIGKASIQDRDLLSLLVRANMAKDLADSQRLSDDEVLGQIPTFLAAGHDTTSSTLSWALHALSLHPEIQSRLRAELKTVELPNTYATDPLDATTLSALNALPFLDAVVRETLRLFAPVQGTARTAVQDDVIPLEKPFTDRHGVLRDSIKINKGESIIIPITALHRSPSIWGPDAKEFRPERWLVCGAPPAAAAIPGVYSNLLTFLGGAHACIGWRFSLLETKLFLHVLLSSFDFKPAVEDIFQRASIVIRPMVRGEFEKGYQLPLFVSPASGA